MTTKTNTNEIIAAILEQNAKLIAILEQNNESVAAETAKASRPRKAKASAKAAKAAKADKPKAKAAELTKAQERVIKGVINRAAKYGYELNYYVTGTWVWFENAKAGQTYKTRSGETRHKDTSEQFAQLNLSTKATQVTYSKKRGQFAIKGFFTESKQGK